MSSIERRFGRGRECRGEVLESGWMRQLAAVFDSETELWPGFLEAVDPACFDRTLREGDPVALFNHSPDCVLGRKSAGTARFLTDSTGLVVEWLPPETGVGRDVKALMERGDLTGGSFGFFTVSHRLTEDPDGVIHRRLLEVELIDAGPVTFPAYPQTARGADYGIAVDDELLAAARSAVARRSALPAEYRTALRRAVEGLTARGGNEAQVAVEEPVVVEATEVGGSGETAAPSAEATERARLDRERLARARVRMATSA